MFRVLRLTIIACLLLAIPAAHAVVCLMHLPSHATTAQPAPCPHHAAPAHAEKTSALPCTVAACFELTGLASATPAMTHLAAEHTFPAILPAALHAWAPPARPATGLPRSGWPPPANSFAHTFARTGRMLI